MYPLHECYCSHCGGVYLATSIDEAILDAPLCFTCLMTLPTDHLALYWGKPPIPAQDRRQASQMRVSRTSPN